MIKLFQFPSGWGLPNLSPFCMKVETYLRMTKTPFEIVKTMDPRRGPKCKLPFIDDNGKRIADSSMIITYLQNKNGDSLDAGLSALEKAQALAMQRLMEEHLYWCFVYLRWIDPDSWPHMKKGVFGRLPFLLRDFIAYKARKKTMLQLYGHGIGRHSREEIYASGIEDLRALNTFLEGKKFLLGDKPTSIDACGYAFIANAVYSPFPCSMSEFAKSKPNFIDYCERMKKLFYDGKPDA